ncbi:MAG TPA: discoidin domain-containing protein [Thermoguttaceae bacterium]|nr:discoidin domain-containing protein [Thermoguttaceae bacterium]
MISAPVTRVVVACAACTAIVSLAGLPARAVGSSEGVTVRRDGDVVEIGNSQLTRAISLRPHVATRSLVNRLTGRRFDTRGDEFVLELDPSKRVPASEFALEDVETDPAKGTLALGLRHPSLGIRAVVRYEIGPDDFFLRKRLALDTGEIYVRSVEVERLRFADAEPAPMPPNSLSPAPTEPVDHLRQVPRPCVWDIGLGQPVRVGGQIFLGLEHPAGHNGYDEDGTVFLRHYPGKAGRFECKPAVLGVAADRPHERLRDVLLRYVARRRQRPVERFTHFFFDAHQFDDQAREVVDTAREALVERGVKLDCLMVNGWAEPTRGIMEPSSQCPEFLRLLTAYSRERLGCPLGLHVYTSGRRSPLLRDWIAESFDTIFVESGPQGRAAYCLADPRAGHLLTANLGRYVGEHGVGMYYYDWGTFACPAGNHRGHMPGYGTEAIADAFLEHLQAMRAAKPDIFLCDTGWFSPWWLAWYDAVYYGPGGDWNNNLDGPPAFATVDLLGTWRDAAMKGLLHARPYYPATGYIDHGAISYRWQQWAPRAAQPRRAFVNYAAMMFLLGPQIAEYILALPELSEENRDDLAAVHRWGTGRDDWLLADTRPLGGDPMQGQVYGFSHVVEGNRGVVGLRNPTVLHQTITLRCDEEAGFWPSPEPFVVFTTYPYSLALPEPVRYGGEVTLTLAAHELLVLEVAPQSDLPRPMVLGGREQVLQSSPERTVIGLLGRAEEALRVISPVAIRKLLVDGEPVPVAPSATEATVRLSPGPDARPGTRLEGVALQEENGAARLRFTADLPKRARADLVLLLTGFEGSKPPVTAAVSCGGESLDVDAPHLRLRDSQGRESGTRAGAADWCLFRTPLPAGHAEVECVLRPDLENTGPEGLPPLGPCRAQLHAFLDVHHELEPTHRIEIDHAPLAQPPRPPLPMHSSAAETVRTEILPSRPVAMEAAEGPRNVALATGPSPPEIEVDSLYPGYTAAPINDGLVSPRGKQGTAWASAESPQSHQITLTWPKPRPIRTLYVVWGQGDWLPTAYRVECRVNGRFVPVAPPESSAEWQPARDRHTVLRFAPVQADAVRILQPSGGGSATRPNLMGIAEVGVYP